VHSDGVISPHLPIENRFRNLGSVSADNEQDGPPEDEDADWMIRMQEYKEIGRDVPLAVLERMWEELMEAKAEAMRKWTTILLVKAQAKTDINERVGKYEKELQELRDEVKRWKNEVIRLGTQARSQVGGSSKAPHDAGNDPESGMRQSSARGTPVFRRASKSPSNRRWSAQEATQSAMEQLAGISISLLMMIVQTNLIICGYNLGSRTPSNGTTTATLNNAGAAFDELSKFLPRLSDFQEEDCNILMGKLLYWRARRDFLAENYYEAQRTFESANEKLGGTNVMEARQVELWFKKAKKLHEEMEESGSDSFKDAED
jgi:hypothetical protein